MIINNVKSTICKFSLLIIALCGFFVQPASAQKWEGLANTPQMGWSTWNKFQGNINETVIKEMADKLKNQAYIAGIKPKTYWDNYYSDEVKACVKWSEINKYL